MLLSERHILCLMASLTIPFVLQATAADSEGTPVVRSNLPQVACLTIRAQSQLVVPSK